jgi:hypothetical protein
VVELLAQRQTDAVALTEAAGQPYLVCLQCRFVLVDGG